MKSQTAERGKYLTLNENRPMISATGAISPPKLAPLLQGYNVINLVVIPIQMQKPTTPLTNPLTTSFAASNLRSDSNCCPHAVMAFHACQRY